MRAGVARVMRTVLLLSAILAAVLIYRGWPTATQPVPDTLQGVMRPQPKRLAPFDLLDQRGETFDLARFSGDWSLVFFGYTYCPDICPTTLATLVATVSGLKSEADGLGNIRVFFISVDPKRDTPEVLEKYMSYFDDRFVGVTGESQEIDNLARQFGAGYIIEPEHAPGEYLVSHASSIFLVDPDARVVASFSPPHKPATLGDQLGEIAALDEYE